MPQAIARYDLVMRHADRDVIVVVDMLETRDMGRNGQPGRLRRAKMLRYDAPAGYCVCYQKLALQNGKPWTWCLTLNDVPQQGIEWERRWVRLVEGDVWPDVD